MAPEMTASDWSRSKRTASKNARTERMLDPAFRTTAGFDVEDVEKCIRVCDLRFGTLRAGGNELREPAKVAVVDVRTSNDALRDTLTERLAQLFDNEWEVDEHFGRPTVVIQVVGSAQEFQMLPRVERVFREGLVRAAQATNAWVFTGGTASGVMAHVGRAFAAHPDVPCIGLALYGNVLGRAEIDAALRRIDEQPTEGPVEYAFGEERNNSHASALEPNHSHFVLIDTGREGPAAWGGEIETSLAIIDAVCAREYELPSVCLLVQGGPNSLTVVLGAVERGMPVIVLADTLGAASAIRDSLSGSPAQERALGAAKAKFERAGEALREAMAEAEAQQSLSARPYAQPVLTEPVLTGSVLTAPVLTAPVLTKPVLAAPRSQRVAAAAAAAESPTPRGAAQPPTARGESAGRHERVALAHAQAVREARKQKEHALHELELLERGLLRVELVAAFGLPVALAQLRRLRELRALVRLFELRTEEAGSDISEALLEGVALAAGLRLPKLLELAVEWDKPAMVATLISPSASPPGAQGAAQGALVDKRSRMATALQLALENGRTGIVSMLLANGAETSDVLLSRLYMLAGSSRLRLFARLQSDVLGALKNTHMRVQLPAVPAAVRSAAEEARAFAEAGMGARRPHLPTNAAWLLRSRFVDLTEPELQQLLLVDRWFVRSPQHFKPFLAEWLAPEHQRRHFDASELAVASVALRFASRRRQQLAHPSPAPPSHSQPQRHRPAGSRTAAAGPPGADEAQTPAKDKAAADSGAGTRLDDIFFWAVLVGDDSLARALWRSSTQHIRLALLARDVCLRMASSTLGRRHRAQLELSADYWGGAALGVLDRVRSTARDPRSDTDVAAKVLLRVVCGRSAHELAVLLRSKAFVGHRHCQLLTAQRWAGHAGALRLVDETAPWLPVLARSLLPFHWAQSLDKQWGLRLLAHVEPAPGSAGREEPAAGAEEEGGEGEAARAEPPWPAFWLVYRIPAVKFWARTLVTHSGLAAILCATLAFTSITAERALVALPDRRQARLELAFALWAVGLALDFAGSLGRRRVWVRRGVHPAWAKLDSISIALVAALVAMRVVAVALLASGRLDPRAADPTWAAAALGQQEQAALNAFAGWVFPLSLAGISLCAFARFVFESAMQLQPVGSLVICAGAMVGENLKSWGVLMVALLAGFGLAFCALVPAYGALDEPTQLLTRGQFAGSSGPFFLPLWATLGMGADPADLEAERPWAPSALLVVLLVLAQVLFLNLLIAMMTETYSRVMPHALTEWQFVHALLVDWTVVVLPTAPPPLNLLLLPLGLLRRCRAACAWSGAAEAHGPPAKAAAGTAPGGPALRSTAFSRQERDPEHEGRDAWRAFLAFAAHEDAAAREDLGARLEALSSEVRSLALAQLDSSEEQAQRTARLGARLDDLALRVPEVPRPRSLPGRGLHAKARSSENAAYRDQRTPVPDRQVAWAVAWPDYDATEWTHPSVLQQPVWADPPEPAQVAELRSRLSYELRPLALGLDGRPLNPLGRTGTSGRGLLGKWGPNHAADPVVVRLRPGSRAGGAAGGYQLVVIQRKDSGQWAFPGGMVDEGELVSETLRREFSEEATALDDGGAQEALEQQLDQVFGGAGELVYEGYVDDPRNTDNAWIETSCRLFELDEELGAQLPLASGSDASNVRWLDVDAELLEGKGITLYADHLRFLQIAMDILVRKAAKRASDVSSSPPNTPTAVSTKSDHLLSA